MIKNKEITAAYILKELFGLCPHEKLDPECYCPDCQTHPRDVTEIDDFIIGFSLPRKVGIHGGVLVQRLINFILTYATLHFQIRHDLCMEIHKDDGASAFYYTGTKKSFAYNVAWLAEILYRIKLGESLTEYELRRILNNG